MAGYPPVCRVCLAINVNLLPIADTPLQFVYERLTSSLLHSTDMRPLTACYMCYALLRKSYKLMMMSVTAENLLTEIVKRNSKVTIRSVYLVDRRANKLDGSLVISPPECIDSIPSAKPTQGPPHLPPPPGDSAPGNASPASGPAVKIKIEEEPDIKTEYVFEEMEASPSPPAMDDDIAMDTNNGSVTETREQSACKIELRWDEPGVSAEQTENETHVIAEDPTRTTQTLRLCIPKLPGEKKYECSVCHRQFEYKNNYERHLRTHTGEKPFECHICGRKFTGSSNLNKHLITHTSEKPFKCVLCHKQFNRKHHLKRHIDMHAGEKPFPCSVCNRRFISKYHLNRHTSIHGGEKLYACNVCPLRFINKQYLQKHLKIHNREKLYSCDVCKRGFRGKATLRTHLMSNNGDEVFQCKKCKRDCHYRSKKQSRMCKKCCLKKKGELKHDTVMISNSIVTRACP